MQSPWSKAGPFALLSLGSFLVACFLLFLLIWKGETLAVLGFTGNLYYIILLPLGLAVAGFLFGVLHSYASYTGKQFGGRLVLSGPIVIFLIVIILGFKLVPDHSTFPITVYVHGPRGTQDIALRNAGEVYMDLDGERRHVPISDQGQAYFPAIPAGFRGRSVPAWVESDKFESVGPAATVRLGTASVYLPVRRKSGRIYGRVDTDYPGCLSHAEIHVAGVVAPVDPVSRQFDFEIPGDRLDDDLILVASAPGCESPSYSVVANSNAIPVTLRKTSDRSVR